MTQVAKSDTPGKTIDWAFFILAGGAAIWLSLVLIRQSFSFGWWQLVFIILFWVALAYFVLPRLHRILTRIYVPDYFIGRARTSDGLLGDPVNLSLLGTEAQIHAAMLAASWTRADDLALRTGAKIVRSTLLRRSYLEAPVSPLLLFDRTQDFAYQQQVDGSPGKRHHVRFWRCPDGWRLPGGSSTDWLAAGTYDRSVGLSLFTLQVTHKIAPNTDTERDHIVATLQGDPGVAVSRIVDFSAGYHARNGGGDSIETDGDLPVIDLTAMPTGQVTDAAQTDSRDRRPAAIVTGSTLVALSAAATIVAGVSQLIAPGDPSARIDAELQDLAKTTITVIAPISLAIGVLTLLIAWRVFLGNPLFRRLAMVLSTLSLLLQIIQTEAADDRTVAGDLPSVALCVLVLLALSSERAATYVRRPHKAPKRVAGTVRPS